jgi:hypothetical protein
MYRIATYQEQHVMQTQDISQEKVDTMNFLEKTFFCFFFPLLIFGVYYLLLISTDQMGTFTMTGQVVDLDEDGYLDVVQHGMRKENKDTAFAGASFWRNQGNGQFILERSEGGWSSAAGDLDGDGDVDLAVYSWYVRTFLNQGGAQGGVIGTFKSNNAVELSSNVNQFGSLVLGDFNQDGKLDGFVAGCCGTGYIKPHPSVSWVWLNQWDDRLKYEVLTLDELDGLAIQRAVVGDLNNDGSLDIFLAITSEGIDPADRVLLNDGSGRFQDSGQRLGKRDSSSAALGDIDGDGDLDILVSTSRGTNIWINQGGQQQGQAGSFIQAAQTIPGWEAISVSLADFDLDGDLDALVGNRNQIRVWWNDGQGSFSRSNQYFRYSLRSGATVGDFNNDGWSDIFIMTYDQSYKVFFNQGNGQFQ